MTNSYRFETVKKFPDAILPVRSTEGSAGYDFCVAEDIVIPPYLYLIKEIEICYNKGLSQEVHPFDSFLENPLSLEQIGQLSKMYKIKPSLVSTGVKCFIPKGENVYLELSVRSSTPLKYWIIMANGVGIIDADYYNNPDNEGEIFFQIINMSPFAIKLKKGDRIGQGIFHEYGKTQEDNSTSERVGGFGSTASSEPETLLTDAFIRALDTGESFSSILYGSDGLL